jgi:parallel beta-helix repeat protein
MSLTKVSYSMITGAPANVLDFGAVGDGVSDDTTAIQAAIDSFSSLGGDIVFPTTSANIYLVSDTLLLTDFIRLTFANNVTLKSADHSNVPIIANADSVGGNVGIEIYGGIFDANKANQDNLNYGTLSFDNVTNCIFSNVYVQGSSSDNTISVGAFALTNSTLCLFDQCIVANAQSEGLYFINCTKCVVNGGEYFNTIGGSGCAISAGFDHTFINVYSHDNAGTNFSANGGNIILIGCIAERSTEQGGIVFGHSGDPSDYSAAIGCRLTDNFNFGIGVLGNSTSVTISGCTISYSVGPSNAGIQLSDGSSNCVVSNNTVFGCFYGIIVSQAALGSIIDGNFVHENNADGIAIVLGTSNCTITNNTCKNNGRTTTGQGIYIDPDSDNNLLIGNRCFDDQSPKTQSFGIGATGEYALVSDNILFGNKDGSLACHPTTIVSKNILTASAQLNFSVTLDAGTTTTVTNGNILTVSDISITPTSAGAASRGIYISAKANGSVTLTHGSGGASDTINFTIG